MQTWPAVVFPAIFQGLLVKSCHGGAGWRSKGKVETFARHNHSTQPELDGELVIATGQAIADGGWVSPDADESKLGKGGVVKAAERARSVTANERWFSMAISLFRRTQRPPQGMAQHPGGDQAAVQRGRDEQPVGEPGHRQIYQ